MPAPPPAEPTRAQRLRRLMPWLVALATLAWLFHIVPLEDLRARLAGVSLPAFAGFVFVYQTLVLTCDSAATWATFRWGIPDARIGFFETLKIRGATYLLAIFHYGVGQGGIVYYLNRRHGVGVARGTGAVMLTAGVNIVLTAFSAFLGVAIGGAPESPALRALVIALGCVFPAYLAVIAARPRLLATRPVLRPLFDAGLSGHAVVALARVPHILTLLAGHAIAMWFFGVTPPLAAILTLLPLVFVVGALPVSVMGLGTAQATAIALFWRYGGGATLAEQQAAVLGYSLSLQFLGLAAQALLGVAFLRSVSSTATVSEDPR